MEKSRTRQLKTQLTIAVEFLQALQNKTLIPRPASVHRQLDNLYTNFLRDIIQMTFPLCNLSPVRTKARSLPNHSKHLPNHRTWGPQSMF